MELFGADNGDDTGFLILSFPVFSLLITNESTNESRNLLNGDLNPHETISCKGV